MRGGVGVKWESVRRREDRREEGKCGVRMREEDEEQNEMENEKDRILSIELKKCRQRIEEKRTSDMVSLH